MPEPPVKVGQPRQLIETGTRRPKRLARAEPNARQLIRVLKTPYGLFPGWARRKRFREARDKLERYRREDAVVLAREALERPSFSSPAQKRPLLEYPVVPRGLAARYASECQAAGGVE